MSKAISHILILSSWYPTQDKPFLGNFVQTQARLLSKRYKVTVLYLSSTSKKNIEISELRNDNLTEIIIYHPKGNNFISRRKEQEKAFERGMNMIRKVDLIHAHVIYPMGYFFVKAKKKFNCKLIVTEHSSFYRKEIRERWNFKERYIIRTTKKYIDALVAVSEFQKKDLEQVFEPKNISIIPNSVNTSLFVPTERKNSRTSHFLHVSTLDNSVKNPKGIIDAVHLLLEKNIRDFKLTIISDEPYQNLKMYVDHKGLSSFIEFLGPLPPKDLVPYFQSSSAFILFSNYETFSIVLAESWASGAPVISTPVGIAHELPKELGIQIAINDPLSLAMAMEKIINGLHFDSEIIRNYALQFSEEKVLEKLTQLYEKVNG